MTTKIRKARLSLGMRAPDLARATNLHVPNLYRLESGDEKAGPAVRARVAAALGRPEAELFDPQGWPLPAEEAE